MSSQLEELLMKCLQKSQSARPGSAAELYESLDHCSIQGHWSEKDAALWWSTLPPEVGKIKRQPYAPTSQSLLYHSPEPADSEFPSLACSIASLTGHDCGEDADRHIRGLQRPHPASKVVTFQVCPRRMRRRNRWSIVATNL